MWTGTKFFSTLGWIFTYVNYNFLGMGNNTEYFRVKEGKETHRLILRDREWYWTTEASGRTTLEAPVLPAIISQRTQGTLVLWLTDDSCFSRSFIYSGRPQLVRVTNTAGYLCFCLIHFRDIRGYHLKMRGGNGTWEKVYFRYDGDLGRDAYMDDEVFADGTGYEGEWDPKNRRPEGYGVWLAKDDIVLYTGTWTAGKPTDLPNGLEAPVVKV